MRRSVGEAKGGIGGWKSTEGSVLVKSIFGWGNAS